MQKQIRIEGKIQKISKKESDNYFNSRPTESKIGAWASLQSNNLKERKILIQKFNYYKEKQYIY